MFMTISPMYWLFVGPAMLLALYAQWRVRAAYDRWSREPNDAGISGAQAAAIVLDRAGLSHVGIEQAQGWLSDHYDPQAKVLRLSPGVYQGQSVAAIGIAAHEAGHALQDAEGYAALQLRSALVPIAGLGSWLAFPLILAGIVFQAAGLIQLGVVAFAAIVAFQLVTLPVEFDASVRAKRILEDSGLMRSQHARDGVGSVLGAAALTYVAATITAMAELLYYLTLASAASNDQA